MLFRKWKSSDLLEFTSLEAFKEELQAQFGATVEGISWEHLGPDRETGPDTYLVKVNLEGITPGMPIGFSDSVLEG